MGAVIQANNPNNVAPNADERQRVILPPAAPAALQVVDLGHDRRGWIRPDGSICALVEGGGQAAGFAYHGNQVTSIRFAGNGQGERTITRVADGSWRNPDGSLANKQQVAEWLSRLAGVYQSLGQPAQSESIFRQALAVAQTMTSGDHLYSLQECFRSWSSFREGVRRFLRHCFGPDLAEEHRAECHEAIGRCLDLQNRSAEATEQYQTAQVILEQAFGANHLRIAEFHEGLAKFFLENNMVERGAQQIRLGQVVRFKNAFERNDEIGRAALVFSRVPRKFRFNAEPGSISFETEDFSALVENIPGVQLPPLARTLLGNLRGARLQGNRFQLNGQSNLQVEIPDLGVANVALNNPRFEISYPEPNNPNIIEFTNFEGVVISAAGIRTRPERVRISLGEQSLGISMTFAGGEGPAAARAPAPQNNGFNLGNLLNRGRELVENVAAACIPNKEFQIALNAQAAQQLQGMFRRAAPVIRGNESLVEAAMPLLEDLPQEIRTIVRSVRELNREGDSFRLRLAQAQDLQCGGMTMVVARDLTADIAENNTAISISNIRGVHVRLPIDVPQLIQNAGINLPNNLQASITGIQISAPDTRGRRTITVESNDVVRRVQVQIDAQGVPVVGDDGRWPLILTIANPLNNDQELSLAILFNRQNQVQMSRREFVDMAADVIAHGGNLGNVDDASRLFLGGILRGGVRVVDAGEAVVDGAVATGRRIRDGALVVGGAVRDGAVAARELLVDGAAAAGGMLLDGAHAVGAGVRAARRFLPW